MTRINPRITTTGLSSSTVDHANANISPGQKIEEAQDKSLVTSVKILKGSPPPALRKFLAISKRMSAEKNEQSSLREPAADSSHKTTDAAEQPQSRGMHHLSLKKFFNPAPPEVAKNALLSAASIGSSFGVGAAMNNIARIHSNPGVKVAGAWLPMTAAMGSAYIEKAIRENLNVKSTEFQHFWHSAISPAALMAANYTYILSNLPKFSPKTPAGIATTMAVSALGAGIGGGLAETAAQISKKNASSSAPATSDPDNKPTTFEHGLGRTFTQIPAVYLNKIIAANAVNGGIPKNLLLAIPAAISVPYALRDEVASKIADSRKRQSSGQASDGDLPRVLARN